jgi:hypothetical protein
MLLNGNLRGRGNGLQLEILLQATDTQPPGLQLALEILRDSGFFVLGGSNI